MKKSFRKVLATLLALTVIFSLSACKGADDTSSFDSSVVADNSATESTDLAIDEASSEDILSSEGASSNKITSSNETPSNNKTSSVNTPSGNSSVNVSTSSGSNITLGYEKPYEGNSAILAGGKSSKYDSQAETLRKKIVNSKDKTFKSQNTYYISYKGNDNNSGTSKDKAWKTLGHLQTKISDIPEGSVVLFERGGIYRGKLFLRKGITLAAYGTGYKPCIYGSSKNYADTSLWKKTTTENVWAVNIESEGSDIGLIVFDHGAKTTNKQIKMDLLKKDYDVYVAGKYAFLYLSKGNPAKLHKNIEISGNGNGISEHIITANVGIKNVTIDNLCIKYGGIHGIQFTNGENITITNCEIGYIGGARNRTEALWYGNGIELWQSCKNILVDNNWVYQCYDAGITNQGKECIQENMTVSNNLVEYCAYNVEYFIKQSGNAKIKDMIYSDNILRFAGYGCFDPENRQGSSGNDASVSLICGWGTDGRTYDCENFVFKNNILDTSYRCMVNVSYPNTERNAKLEGNAYYQEASTHATICIADKKTVVKAENKTQFKEQIAKIDPTAKAVDFASK